MKKMIGMVVAGAAIGLVIGGAGVALANNIDKKKRDNSRELAIKAFEDLKNEWLGEKNPERIIQFNEELALRQREAGIYTREAAAREGMDLEEIFEIIRNERDNNR